MADLSKIQTNIDQNKIDVAIEQLGELIKENPGDDKLYYLMGNAYRKQENWQMAINSYLEAVEINPDSPAAEAKDMLLDILEFYNKDMYNQ